MAKKVNTVKVSAKGSAKVSTAKTSAKKTANGGFPTGRGQGGRNKVTVPVKTGVNPEWKNIRQIDTIGKLELEYGNIYRLSPEFGHRYRFEVQRDKSVHIFKFSRSGRKFRFIAEASSLETAKREVNRGKYKAIFAI